MKVAFLNLFAPLDNAQFSKQQQQKKYIEDETERETVIRSHCDY
jgi:hypothetical protein